MGTNAGTKLKENYDICEKLGSGNFATVKKAKRKVPTDEIPADVAVKIIDKSKVEDMEDIEREIHIMKTIKHEHVVVMYEVYDEPKKMHLIMELITGGELFDRIVLRTSYTERNAADVMKELASALEHIHAKGVVHRDLKPENILLKNRSDDAGIKVADFGLARVMSKKDMMMTACGTPGYVAPEVLKNRGYDSGAVDMWSAGVVLYILLCGFPPFYEDELPALFDQIMKGRYDFPSPWWDKISKEAKDLVSKLLTVDPAKRFTASQCLKHPWIAGAEATDIADNLTTFKKYNAARKLKKACMAIKGLGGLTSALKGAEAAAN